MNKASEIIGVTDDNSSQGQGQEQKEVKLVDIPVADENVALNLMVSFLSLAQRRGCFTFDESAKIWECVKKFQKQM
jgi:hypothetical protein